MANNNFGKNEVTEFESMIRQINEILKKQNTDVCVSKLRFYKDMAENLIRCESLLSFYGTLSITSLFPTKAEPLEDILRVTVVFIHATVEEFFRRLAVTYSIDAGEEALRNIPFKYKEKNLDQLKLSDLIELKDKNVINILDDSVRSYYDFSSFNNTNQYTSLLKRLGLPVEQFSEYYSGIEELCERRHIIVHRLDKSGCPDALEKKVNELTFKHVSQWLITVLKFLFEVLSEVEKKYPARLNVWVQ